MDSSSRCYASNGFTLAGRRDAVFNRKVKVAIEGGEDQGVRG
jgi:hypothetical protein